MKFKQILSTIFLLSSFLGYAQTPVDSLIKNKEHKAENKRKKQRGDRYYELQGYKASAEIYESLKLDKEKYPLDAMRKLANAYRLNGDTQNEELWYARFITEESTAADILFYAQALQSNDKCEEANKWFAVYDRVKTNPGDNRGKELIVDCSKPIFKQNDLIKLVKLDGINSDQLDYSAAYFADGIVFSSTRPNDRLQGNNDIWTKQDFCDIYYAARIEGMTFEKPRPLRGGVNKRFHDGTASFTQAQDQIYFSRSNNLNNKVGLKKGKPQLKIFSSRLVQDAWEEVEELPINQATVVSCHPAISENGQFMVFASNRVDGFGGMDLYLTENVAGVWTTAINLGPSVNTPGNEIFPTYVNQTLYFSSNGRKGMGGLDIFSSKIENNDPQKWSTPENLGTPYNSTRDDFGFTSNSAGTEGFITSNRDFQTQDDIYGWTMKGGFPANRQGPVYAIDKATKQRIPDAYITIKDGDGTLIQRGRSALVNHVVEDGQTYYFEVRKIGYAPVTRQFTSKELLADASLWHVEMDLQSCVQFAGKIKNEKGALIPNTGIKMFNTYTGEYKSATIDENGRFELCIDCDFEYQLTATAEGYPNKQVTISTFGNCSKPITKDLILEKEARQYTMPSNISLQDLTAGLYKPTEGQSITLAPFYYDFDAAKIREDAAKELNHVVLLMNQYPSMEILLASHTDARGEAKYNRLLSQRRAESATRYLISKGIAAKRLLPSGFGESRLLNTCKECSEAEHQQNRRTEIRIIKLDEQVNVDYGG